MRWEIEDTPERTAFRSEFRAWLGDVLPATWLDLVDAGDDAGLERLRTDSGFNPFVWQGTIGRSPYAAPLWPKEYGGLSGETWMQQVIRSELVRYRLPTVSINLLGVGLAGPTIIEHGTEAQKERYLRKILSAEEIWCQLFSEPGSGSDLASLSTRAVRDGDEWVVNGQKVWTTIAQFAAFGMLLARSDPDVPKHEGLSYFIIDMKSPGVEVRPLRQMTGSSEFNEVFLTDVRIPDTNRVGDVGDGWRCARTTLMNERVALAGVSLDPVSFTGGVRRDAWQSYLDQIPDRSDRRVRQQLAQFYIESEVKEITAFRANSARMRGQQPGPEGAVNKVFNAEYNQRRSNFAVDVNGMAGIAWAPDDVQSQARATTFLRARANTIEGGTSEVLRNQMAERILGLPRDFEADKGVAWAEVTKNLTAIGDPGGPADTGNPTAGIGAGSAAVTPVSPSRVGTAAAIRRLGHAIVGHDLDDRAFDRITATVEELATLVAEAPTRERPPPDMSRDLFVVPPPQGGARGSHFPDCIVTGPANPMGVAAQVLRDGDDAVLRATLGAAFEGAPGRAHGGMVAALFDETMGFVLSITCTPAFTGRLTVTYRAPVPLGVPLEFRARLTGREGRKLLMAGDARHGETVLAEAEALFVAVDPDRFAAGKG